MIMKEKILKYRNSQVIVFVTNYGLDIKESLEFTIGNLIELEKTEYKKEIVEIINDSKIKKIYLLDYDDFYRFMLPRLNKTIEVCWVFKNSFSDLSNPKVRQVLNTIFEFIDRDLINTIGCINEDNLRVFNNAGYNTEYIKLNIKHLNKNYKESNSIGILSNDYDPNNNFYNQLASLKYIDYDYCKIKYIMPATKKFLSFFKIKSQKYDSLDEVIKDNFVNLYINFTNTNNELIKKSFDLGIPCIVGNTNFFDRNKYLKEHLVLKSDDDIKEISEKIDFARKNREIIISEYNKMECL